MNQIIKRIIGFFTLVLIFNSSITYAETFWDNDQSADPTVFKVRPTDFKLCGDWDQSTGECTGDDIYTIVKTMTADDGRCDIAGVEQGAVACNYGPTNSMPIGAEYHYARFELDRTMWLKGTITNTGSNSGMTSCHTDSSNTQSSNSVSAEGSVGGIPSIQAIKFLNGAGNDTVRPGGTNVTANTDASEDGLCVANPARSGCGFGYIQSLKDQGATHLGTGDGSVQIDGTQDYWMLTRYYVPDGPIWQSGLEENDTSIVLIYLLDNTYIRSSADVFPTVKMSFDVTGAMDAHFIRSEEAGKDDVSTCTIFVGNPGVSVSITD